jgi:hypothetical protein
MPAEPTNEELVAKTSELLALYLKGIVANFTDTAEGTAADKINDAINFRGMLINEPAKGNIATLADVADQFDAQGNRTDTAQFTMHNPDRANLEIKYLIGADKSDREDITFASVYFKQGADMLANNRMVAYAPKLGDVLRPTVANELRDVVGFTDPLGYTPRAEFIAKVNSLLETKNFNDMVKAIVTNFKAIPAITAAGRSAKEFAENHISDKLTGIRKTDDFKTSDQRKYESYVTKYSLLQQTYNAAIEFAGSCDRNKLIETMVEIKRENETRKTGILGIKTKTTDIINQVTLLSQRLLNPNQKSLSSDRSPRPGLFTGSKSGSPDSSGSKSPSPVDSPRPDTDSDSDDEKQDRRPRSKT